MKVDDFAEISKTRAYSESIIGRLREALMPFERHGLSVVLNGSIARLEASELSDIDYFVLVPRSLPKEDVGKLTLEIRQEVVSIVGRPPADGGVFGDYEAIGSFARAVGGLEDDNASITRRILFLTEGVPLAGQEIFEVERKAVIEGYIRPSISDHALAQFLLNDIIRFYRTMCVDFEHKTVQMRKPWGIRNIKLVFSRKMLYFGGILICAETAQRTRKEKLDSARRLMDLAPIDRVLDVCGSAAERALRGYDFFLGEMAKGEVRTLLESIPEDRAGHTEEFKSLKNKGHYFTLHLISALKATYPESHPIHRSLLM